MIVAVKYKIKKSTLLNALTLIYFFYGFFEPYLNQIVGPIMRFFIIVLAGLHIFRIKGKIKIEQFSLFYLLWLLYSCFTLIWARDYSIFRIHFFTVFGFVILLICLLQKPIENDLISGMIYTFWSGSFLIGLLSLFFHSAYHFDLRFTARQVLTLFGVQTDPNNQAIFLMFGISISLYYLIVKREKLILCISTIVVNMISMMLTASRGGILSFGVLTVIVIIFIIKDWKAKVWAIVVTIISLAIISRFIPSFLNTSTLERLVEFDTYEGGGNRITIWKNAIALMNENPLFYLFGSGWGSYYNYNGWAGMHNTYLEILCNTGIIGLFLFFSPIIYSCYYLWKKEKVLPVFIIISIFLPSFFIDCINKRFFWNAIFFLLICYFYEMQSLKNDKSTI